VSSRGVGPGTERVGRLIGRVGVVTLPAVQVGLDLDERVVRRHVQRLEDLGWLTRKTWMWGEGSVVWLTAAGIDGVGLHGLRPVKVRREKSEPGITTITRGVLVGFSAARLERRGYEWLSARELAVDEPRWAVRHRHDYGHSTQLPDLVVWVPGSEKPVAIVCEESRRREDRQRWRLEGWRDAINAGRYECVQYDCANEPLATWIKNLGKKIGLTRPQLRSIVQMPAEKIATLTRVDQNTEPPTPEPEAARPQLRLVEEPAPVRPPAPARIAVEPRPPEKPEPFVEEPETPEEYERRRQHYYEIFGSYDSFGPPEKSKRRWFR
jgi:hypothetical protein